MTCALLLDPGKTGLPHRRQASGCAFAFALPKGMHDDIMLGQPVLRPDPPSHDRVGAQGKTQVVTAFQKRCKAFRFVDREETVRILGPAR